MKRPDILKYVLQKIDIKGCEKNSLLPNYCNSQCVCYRKLSFFPKTANKCTQTNLFYIVLLTRN